MDVICFNVNIHYVHVRKICIQLLRHVYIIAGIQNKPPLLVKLEL